MMGLGPQTCALLPFSCGDLDIALVTLKLECDLDILKMYLSTRNEATTSRDVQNVQINFQTLTTDGFSQGY